MSEWIEQFENHQVHDDIRSALTPAEEIHSSAEELPDDAVERVDRIVNVLGEVQRRLQRTDPNLIPIQPLGNLSTPLASISDMLKKRAATQSNNSEKQEEWKGVVEAKQTEYEELCESIRERIQSLETQFKAGAKAILDDMTERKTEDGQARRYAIEKQKLDWYYNHMPELSRFLGIVIGMFPRDHAPPHFHALYDEYQITVDIQNGIVHGNFPKRALRHVLEWLDYEKMEAL